LSAGYEPIRSYERIFRPERRIYQVEGHSLPVPGGVPLRWLAYTAAALFAALALGSGSLLVPALAGLAVLAAGAVAGEPERALAAAGLAFGATWLAGVLLGALDWPLRLIVFPAAVATVATQASPDGRRADRFAASWLALRLAPRRRSLGRALPSVGQARHSGGEMWVARGSGR
jgi:hypothetical protein